MCWQHAQAWIFFLLRSKPSAVLCLMPGHFACSSWYFNILQCLHLQEQTVFGFKHQQRVVKATSQFQYTVLDCSTLMVKATANLLTCHVQLTQQYSIIPEKNWTIILIYHKLYIISASFPIHCLENSILILSDNYNLSLPATSMLHMWAFV